MFKRVKLIIISACCLILAYPIVYVVLSHYYNLNTLNITTSEDLNIQNIRVELSIWGTDFIDRTVYQNNKMTSQIPEEYGENDWYLSYKNKHVSFRHFKTNRRSDHSYDFHFFEENDTVKCSVNIEGPNPRSTTLSLDNPTKTDVGAEVGLRILRD